MLKGNLYKSKFLGLVMAENKTEEKKEIKKVVEVKEKKVASKPSWVKMKPAELEKVVIELAGEGKSPAQIGLVLRDKYGVPKAKLLGKGIIDILNEKKIKYRDDLDVVNDRIEKLKGHFGKNKHDYPASRALTKRLWVLRALKERAA